MLPEVEALIETLHLSPGEALRIARETAQDQALESVYDLNEDQQHDLLDQLQFLTATFVADYDRSLEAEKRSVAQGSKFVVRFLLNMPTSQMPSHLTKISYILSKEDKARVERAAKKAGVSMSALISRALAEKGILKSAA